MMVCLCILFVYPSITVDAATSGSDLTKSDVLDDLKNMGIDALSYLTNGENAFIGMSQYYTSDGELKTYVYLNYMGAETDRLTISISTADKDSRGNIVDVSKIYHMDFVKSFNTLCKYEVSGLDNLNSVTRRYKITRLSANGRKFLDLDSIRIFHGITNDTIEVFSQEVETITITEKEVGFFCYGEESKWNSFWGKKETLGNNKTYTDAWYIFFNTDKPMDSIKEIEITYRDYRYSVEVDHTFVSMDELFTKDVIMSNDTFTAPIIEEGLQTKVAVTPGTTMVSQKGNWWDGYQTVYREIDNILDLRKYNYKNTNGDPFCFTEQAEKYTWAVNFLNTTKTSTFDYHYVDFPHPLPDRHYNTTIIDGYGVENTAILRITYEINGIVKNAYVIDTPTDDFFGDSAEEKNDGSFVDIYLSEKEQDIIIDIGKVIALVMLVVLVIVLLPYITPIFSFIASGFIYSGQQIKNTYKISKKFISDNLKKRKKRKNSKQRKRK